ncbi:undecaprenyldiphospho-muramoylpentapeptide beta-N-acetylglucosaminyltransferase [Dellaglioa carnosa]|uniref:UDP-N-acetylglucosamine--N-acetylmuramyl-(pentapeptide) pyrophosphoryl-undecaprenol N-acetylglucosamine transferase n=1 Tax=Dellaglioa carnosa TaxID=2995136 RepID=A0ABT4JKE8_9LACO|nr:undecaprenyldiphospho-muramoylpentapeptide beta-N-acetylglucosaminyltransferase [Dellaglioa carnosa]MCZ2490760.1 undecaprenyldiphospho-muramoylpentapeptide beta-N-acetylglucosaminyltransferase [Dellaglioa carnosa]MCZ2493838.1 undecaprenyldiphospho-muramoylpentapeptide beta-N-acetylglucosaminyltransferase [Dellaglioa carnosa]MDK1730702.1 undecaprenyldiphospho-muramoylpentapeptide beta-N-acetylglucosaminyltransferase [Dellaglioa carnosa]
MKIIVSGGGTGGHIYPALALIEALKIKDPTTEFLYVGTEKGLESRIVPDNHIPFKTIKIQGFKRSLSMENVKTIQLFLKSVKDAKKMIKAFKPDIVIGTGGYVSGAVVYAAARLHIPTIVHEQNSVAGITNKFLSHFVDKVAISFESVADQFPKKKVVFTGNPRAQQVVNETKIDALSEYDLSDDIPTMLVFGGSRGAEKINQAMVTAIPELNKKPYQILFVTGNVHYDKIMDNLNGVQLNKNIIVKPYLNNMPNLLSNISVILGRAGATSIAEITALGLPSILVPSPYVTNNHQTKNAMSLVNNNAAKLITEDELTGEKLVEVVDELMLNDGVRKQMAGNSRKMGVPDAADRLIVVMEDLIKKRK